MDGFDCETCPIEFLVAFDEPQSEQERLQTRRDLLLAAPTFPFLIPYTI